RKINQYKHDDMKNDEILQDMKEQIVDYGMFTGLTAVEGPGIILTLNDGVTDVKEEGFEAVMSKLLHIP
ncbi:Division initiation protein, partial [human gut metagenome]